MNILITYDLLSKNNDTCLIHNAENNDTSQTPRGRKLLVHVASQMPHGRQTISMCQSFY